MQYGIGTSRTWGGVGDTSETVEGCGGYLNFGAWTGFNGFIYLRVKALFFFIIYTNQIKSIYQNLPFEESRSCLVPWISESKKRKEVEVLLSTFSSYPPHQSFHLGGFSLICICGFIYLLLIFKICFGPIKYLVIVFNIWLAWIF